MGSRSAPPIRPAGPAPQSSAGSDLEQQIARFTAGLDERGGYRVPTDRERLAFTGAVAHLLDGDQEAARAGLTEIDFTLRTVTDAVSGRRYAEVADRVSESGHTNRGWGRVYVDLDHPPRWSVQVPHPVADARTEHLGARVLRGAPGGVMVLAGAHRNAGKDGAADMAHHSDSIFHSVVDELMRRNLPGVQLHGFANDSFPGRDAVVSTGVGDKAVADAEELAAALRRDGLNVCRAYSERCKLTGRENEQGLVAAAENVRFLHIELNKSVRSDDGKLDRTAASIATLTDRWSRQ
ncbi:hypothetical protein PV721_25870 [Streptomyces sp. MB09-01]|uniref:hypothetical protein n=1 Tax=Streptomyces sp. MB09-01 TaxID=3028666 RepID=UPI0029A42E16|nr:hypothetical protein [Streptomyces sp. MB09-01]MDX3537731.1 hypothetical protein [Streptomyces sp. MB09-01]